MISVISVPDLAIADCARVLKIQTDVRAPCVVALIAHERQGSLALVTLQGNMADVEEAPEEQNFHQENDAEDQMDVDQEPELDK